MARQFKNGISVEGTAQVNSKDIVTQEEGSWTTAFYSRVLTLLQDELLRFALGTGTYSLGFVKAGEILYLIRSLADDASEAAENIMEYNTSTHAFTLASGFKAGLLNALLESGNWTTASWGKRLILEEGQLLRFALGTGTFAFGVAKEDDNVYFLQSEADDTSEAAVDFMNFDLIDQTIEGPVKWRAGAVEVDFGGTGSDLSATGPGFVKQASTGAVLTVADIDISDVTGGESALWLAWAGL